LRLGGNKVSIYQCPIRDRAELKSFNYLRPLFGGKVGREMKPWTYRNYTSSITSDVDFGATKRGYSLREAIGFAQSELALRLEEFPEEAPMALVALAAFAIRQVAFDAFQRDDLFVSELREAMESEKLAFVISVLQGDELDEFKRDVSKVKSMLRC
jgi:hypothetical protein